MVLRSVLLVVHGALQCFALKAKHCVLLLKQNTAKHHAQSVKVKMALTEDLTQKQHTFGECTLYVSYCPWLNMPICLPGKSKKVYLFVELWNKYHLADFQN